MSGQKRFTKAPKGVTKRGGQASEQGIESKLRYQGQLSIIDAGVLLALTLIGWFFGIHWLQKLIPTAAPMNPLLMFALALAQVSAWLQRKGRPEGRLRTAMVYGSALTVAAIGLIKLADYALGMQMCPDDLLFASQISEGGDAGAHISAFNAVCLLLLGWILLTIDSGPPERVLLHVQVLLGVPLLSMLAFSMVSFLYHAIIGDGSANHNSDSSYTLSTWLCINFIVAGLFMSRPNAGQMRIISAPTYAGFTARIMYPVSFGTPIILGLFYALALREGWYSAETAFAVFIIEFAWIILSITVLNAIRLHRVDLERQKTLDELHVRILRDEKAARLRESLVQTEDIARAVAGNQRDATQALLAYLARRTGIPQMCLLSIAEESDVPQLEVLASYAYGDIQQNERKIAFGEGLAGQCAAESRTILVDEVPENYFRIRAASVELLPKQLLFIPLIVNGELVGVLEAALLHPLTEDVQEYLNKAVNVIAFAIYRLRQEQRVQTLLRQIDRLDAPSDLPEMMVFPQG